MPPKLRNKVSIIQKGSHRILVLLNPKLIADKCGEGSPEQQYKVQSLTSRLISKHIVVNDLYHWPILTDPSK